jgi:membrane-bound ClpP family serine protease
METPVSSIESLYERVEAYVKTTIELSKLKLLESTTKIASSLLARLGVIVMVSLFALLLTIGIALFIGELLGKSYYGFFIVAAFYLVAAIVLHFFLQKWIKKPVSELIIKQALK